MRSLPAFTLLVSLLGPWHGAACAQAPTEEEKPISPAWEPRAPDGKRRLCPLPTHPKGDGVDAETRRLRGLIRKRAWDEAITGLDRVRATPRAAGRYQSAVDLLVASPGADLPLLDAWCAARPTCPWPFLLRGAAGIDEAWRLRGSGWAKDVKDDQWRAFGEHLGVAKDRLLRAVELDPRGPWAPTELITVVLGGGLPLEEASKWFDAAVAAAPRHVAAYQGMASLLQPRWHGTEEAVLGFVDRALAARADEPALALVLFDALDWVDIEVAQKVARLKEPKTRARVTAALDRAVAAYPQEWKLTRARAQLAERLEEHDIRLAMTERMAAQGDADCSRILASHYLDGPGEDEVRGLRHLCVTVHETEDAQAIHAFALILLRVRKLEGMPLDGAAGRFYLKRAAELGNVISALILGCALYDGTWGVEKDEVEARRWLTVAAEQRHVESMGRLGDLLYRGVGGPRDPAAAERLLQAGVRGADPVALLVMGTLIEDRQPGEAVRMYQHASARGSAEAGRRLEALLQRRPDLRQR